MARPSLILLVISFLISLTAPEETLFPLSIVHINDFHARFEETNYAGTVCKLHEGQVCIGGYARTVTVVKHLLRTRQNPLYLNAGDNFQGTLWYNMFRWNVTSTLLNMVPADAMTLGNHEFDNGVAGVVPFLDAINSPVPLCNVDASEEPDFIKYSKSIVIERAGRKIGIIGVISKKGSEASNAGKLRFLDEASSVKAEAQILKDQGTDIIVVLSHCGLAVDEIIAADGGENVDIIVGGHSHTFLYSGNNSGIPGTVQGLYPTVISQASGHRVLIVQAAAYTKLVGDIVLYFDDQGVIQRWEGNPHYLGPEVLPDPDVDNAMLPWKLAVDKLGNGVVGSTLTDLSRQGCNYRECALGNLIADAFVDSTVHMAEPGHWSYASIGLANTGGIRVGLSKGELSYKSLIEVIPFENTINIVELRGDHLLRVLEHGTANSNIQLSGLRVVYNMTEPYGNRVKSVQALCHDCPQPRYEPLNPFQYYRVAANSHMTGGGGGFTMFKDFGRNLVVGDEEINALVKFVRKRSPLRYGLEGRVIVLN